MIHRCDLALYDGPIEIKPLEGMAMATGQTSDFKHQLGLTIYQWATFSWIETGVESIDQHN